MKTGRVFVGMAGGLILALILVAGLGALGPGATHIELVRTPTLASSQPDVTGQSAGQATVTNLTPMSTPSPSTLGALSADSSEALGFLFIPMMVGLVIGALFYGVLLRREDA
jgi:hypothetical protein